MDFHDLDSETREHMLIELEHDLDNGDLYSSKWFTAAGESAYPDLLRQAVIAGDDATLAGALRGPGTFMETYQKRTPSGGITQAAVPITAPTTFAEGEFNRFYLRGLCAKIIANGGGSVEIYRARESANPRSSSQELIGQHIDAAALLEDLRRHTGVETALGLPYPNSGLSGRIPR